MRNVPWIVCAGLLTLGGCRQAEPPSSEDKNPVNATPAPEVSATGVAMTGTEEATPQPGPATPPATLVPSPGLPAALSHTGG